MMSNADAEPELSETVATGWAEWLRTLLLPSEIPGFVLYGISDSGRTALGKWLSKSQPHLRDGIVYRYWNPAEEGAPATESHGWSRLWAALGRDHHRRDDPIEDLGEFLSESEPAIRIVLVVDDWDDAVKTTAVAQRHRRDIGVAGYAVLDRLLTLVKSDQVGLQAHARVGLVLLTRLPTPESLITLSRDSQQPGFGRLSQKVTRLLTPRRLPLVAAPAIVTALRERGLCYEPAAEIARDVGGWLGAADAAARVAIEAGGRSDSAARRAFVSRELPVLMNKYLDPFRSPRLVESDAQLWARLRSVEASDAAALERLGLPMEADHHGPSPRLALVYRQLFSNTWMFVDTENFRVPYDHETRRNEAWRRPGAARARRRAVQRMLQRVAEEQDVHEDHTILVGRNQQTIRELVGDPWCRTFTTDRTGAGSDDDALAASLVTETAILHPGSRVVLVTGDAGWPPVLRRLSGLEQVVIYTPKEPGKQLPLATGWTVIGNLLTRYPDLDVPVWGVRSDAG
jgi:hypothetical protein